MSAAIRGLALTPVKATRLQAVDEIALERSGVRENRRFFLIDARNRLVNGMHLAELNAVVATYSEPERRLRLQLPHGETIEDEVRPGEEVQARFYSRSATARLVEGRWSRALSELLGNDVRLVEAGEAGGVDRGAGGAVSLISAASLERLAGEAGCDGVDSRRFRMLIEVDGIEAHGEDQWVGRTARLGDQARVKFEGHVGRCLITSRDPVTGVVDLPTLDILRSYRGEVEATEPLPFGIYGRVLAPGTVRVGDAVALEG